MNLQKECCFIGIDDGVPRTISMNNNDGNAYYDYHFISIRARVDDGNRLLQDAHMDSMSFDLNNITGGANTALMDTINYGQAKALLIYDPKSGVEDSNLKLWFEKAESADSDYRLTWDRVRVKDGVDPDYFHTWTGNTTDDHLLILYGLDGDVKARNTIKQGLPDFGELVANVENTQNDVTNHGIYTTISSSVNDINFILNDSNA